SARDLRAGADQLRSQAALLRAEAGTHEQRSADLERRGAHASERWEAPEGAHIPEQQLRDWFDHKTKNWESDLEQLVRRHERSVDDASEAARKAELELSGVVVQADEAAKRTDSRQKDLAELIANMGITD